VYRARYCEVKKIWIWMNPYLVTIQMHINQTFLYDQPTLIQTSDELLSEKETLTATINRVILNVHKGDCWKNERTSSNLTMAWNWQFFDSEILQNWNCINKGLCRVALPFTLKSILRQKKNYGNSNISSCKNVFFQKSSIKTRILQEIIIL